MDIAYYFDGRRKFDKSGLTEEDFACQGAYGGDFCVLETDRLTYFAGITDVEQALYHVVNIDGFEPHVGVCRNGGTEGS